MEAPPQSQSQSQPQQPPAPLSNTPPPILPPPPPPPPAVSPPPVQPPSKLRLMCSYGGHIVPRPHDKSLCYVGGDTRIIVIPRHTTLSELYHRLSKTLVNLHKSPPQQQQPFSSFSLKYNLPTEDLDSLISITTNEDLDNMVDEYDRLNNILPKPPGRLRLFLFPTPPPSSSSPSSLLLPSEDWFFNALNGKPSAMSLAANSDRGFSESSSVNNLLCWDDDFSTKEVGSNNGNGNGNDKNSGGNNNNSNDLETTSSFGSTSSSPSMIANLPPIKVHVVEEEEEEEEEDNQIEVRGLGIEDQFQQQMIVGGKAVNLKKEARGFVADGVAVGTVVSSGLPVVVGGGAEYAATRVFSDDDRSSDHGGYSKVQQFQHQFQQKQTGPLDFPSPDSVSSNGSVTNPLSRQRQAMYQEPIMQQFQSESTRFVPNQVVDPKTAGEQHNSKISMQQEVQEPSYVLSGQFDQNHPHLHQQQFVHHGAQYIPAGAVPISSDYPIYSSQQQQSVYYVSTRQTPQAYNLPMQQQQPTSYSELGPNAPLTRRQTPPMDYNQVKNAPSPTTEMAGGVYRTSAAGGQQLVPAHQYVGYTQVHRPSQSLAPFSSANFEFADPTNGQVYYTPLPPQLAAQYQKMTLGTTVVLPDATENVRTSQPWYT